MIPHESRSYKRFQLKLTQEEKKGYLNSCKLIENWRNMRRDAKTKDLKRDVGVLKETFDRALQKKNRHIELLMQVCDACDAAMQMQLTLTMCRREGESQLTLTICKCVKGCIRDACDTAIVYYI